MNKPIHNFFANDHKRIDSILEKAIKNPEAIDMDLYKGKLPHFSDSLKI